MATIGEGRPSDSQMLEAINEHHKEHHDREPNILYLIRRVCLWKRTAKKWRAKAIGATKASKLEDVVKMVGLDDQLSIAQADADRRRELLVEANHWVLKLSGYIPDDTTNVGDWNDFLDRLGKELADASGSQD